MARAMSAANRRNPIQPRARMKVRRGARATSSEKASARTTGKPKRLDDVKAVRSRTRAVPGLHVRLIQATQRAWGIVRHGGEKQPKRRARAKTKYERLTLDYRRGAFRLVGPRGSDRLLRMLGAMFVIGSTVEAHLPLLLIGLATVVFTALLFSSARQN